MNDHNQNKKTVWYQVKHLLCCSVLAQTAHVLVHILFPLAILHDIAFVAVFGVYYSIKKFWGD